MQRNAGWLMILLLMASGCSLARERDLDRVSGSAKARLRSSDFLAVVCRLHEKPTPSQGVEHFFAPANLESMVALPAGVTLGQGHPTLPWSVVLRADDEDGMVIIESYGENLARPLRSRAMPWPPGR